MNGVSKMKFKKFNLNDMCEHATIAMVAKRNTGKSVLIKDILKTRNSIPAPVIICKTEKLNSSYGDHVPDSFIYYNFDTKILTRIFNRQKRLISDNEKRKRKGKALKDDRVMLIMDDCMSDSKWVKDPNISELFFNGRHYHVSFILALQYSKGLPPAMRGNLDYIFLLAEDFKCNRKRLYDDYAGMFPSFDIFDQVFTEMTENHGCMVINNRVHTKNLEDKVFWYKADFAEVSKGFRSGSKRYWNFHKKYFDYKWDKRVPTFDLAKSKCNKNKENIIIEKVSE